MVQQERKHELKRLMQLLKWTVEETARFLDVSSSAVIKWRAGNPQPPLAVIMCLRCEVAKLEKVGV